MRSQSSTLVSVIGPNAPPTPALLNSTSSPPKRSTAAPISDSTSSSSATSVRRNSSRSGSATSSTRRWPLSALKSPTTTLAPSAMKRSTVARPMPLAPPVMTATRSESTSAIAGTLRNGASAGVPDESHAPADRLTG